MACVGHLTLWVVQELRDRAEFEAKVRGLKLVQSEWTKGLKPCTPASTIDCTLPWIGTPSPVHHTGKRCCAGLSAWPTLLMPGRQSGMPNFVSVIGRPPLKVSPAGARVVMDPVAVLGVRLVA